MRQIHPLRCKHPGCEGASQNKTIIITIRVSSIPCLETSDLNQYFSRREASRDEQGT
jgi:hypothetical protein